MISAAFKRIARFGDDVARELALLEYNVATKFGAVDALPIANFSITDLKTASYTAKFGELVRLNPAAGSVVVLLPRPDDPKADEITVCNDTTSTTVVTVKTMGTDCTVSGGTSLSINGSRFCRRFHPDPIRKNWIALDSGVLPASSGTPVIYQTLVYDGTSYVPAYELQPVTKTLITFPVSNGTADVTAYTVPASPTGTARFRGIVDIRTETITGTGNVVLRAGTTTGGNELLLDSTAYTSATSAGTIHGGSPANCGTSMSVLTFYEFDLAAGDAIKVRATTAGSSGSFVGTAYIYVYGRFRP